jgi:hypothetical protein
MVNEFLSEPETRRQVGAAARNLLDANRGALSRLMSVITPLVAAR